VKISFQELQKEEWVPTSVLKDGVSKTFNSMTFSILSCVAVFSVLTPGQWQDPAETCDVRAK